MHIKKCQFCSEPLPEGRTLSCSRECAVIHRQTHNKKSSEMSDKTPANKDSIELPERYYERPKFSEMGELQHSRKDVEDYKDLVAEELLLDDIMDPLLEIKHLLKRKEKRREYAQQLVKGIVAESSAFLKGLERRIWENEKEKQALAAKCLWLDHGIRLGEKIPFYHPGTNESGFIRVEEVSLDLMESVVYDETYMREFNPSEDYYYVSGRKFKKDGELGKLTSIASLQLKK